jgi:hypothetical protein
LFGPFLFELPRSRHFAVFERFSSGFIQVSHPFGEIVMAREGQGLQILVIIFVFLTMILAFGTWYGISNWATTAQNLETERAKVKTADKLTNDFRDESDAMRYMLGYGPLAEDTYKQVSSTLSTGSVDSKVQERFKEVQADYNNEMSKLEASLEGPKNFRTLTTKLLDVTAQRNEDVGDLEKKLADVILQKDSDKAAFDKAIKAAEDAVVKAQADLDAVVKQSEIDKRTLQAALTEAEKKIDAQGKETERVQKESMVLVSTLQTDKQVLEKRVEEQAQVIRDLQPDDFDVADGKIIISDPSTRSVMVNLGSADNLRPQISFAVYGKNVTKFVPENKKADVQIERILGPHLATAKILKDSLENPILTDDFIHTPAWTPERRLEFAIAGFFDLDGDTVNDQERFKAILTANNGAIVAELTQKGETKGELSSRIRFVIVGDEYKDDAMASKFGLFNKEAEQAGLELRYYKDVLQQMGVRREVLTGRPGQDFGSDDEFKTRRPPARNGSSAYPK